VALFLSFTQQVKQRVVVVRVEMPVVGCVEIVQKVPEASLLLTLAGGNDPHVEHPLLYVWSGDSALLQKLPEPLR